MVGSRSKCSTPENDIFHVGERVPCSGCLPALFSSPSLSLSIALLSSDSHTIPGTCHFLFLSVENQVSAIWVVLTPSHVCHLQKSPWLVTIFPWLVPSVLPTRLWGLFPFQLLLIRTDLSYLCYLHIAKHPTRISTCTTETQEYNLIWQSSS